MRVLRIQLCPSVRPFVCLFIHLSVCDLVFQAWLISFFLIFLYELRLQQKIKVTKPIFWEKFWNWLFWTQYQHFWTFLESSSFYLNPIFYLMTGINDWVKLTVLDFWGKFLFCAKMGYFWPKINFLRFPLNVFVRCFWNCAWWQALKTG